MTLSSRHIRQLRFRFHYSGNDVEEIIAWLDDRAAGYASLKRFEGGAEYPPDAPVRHVTPRP